MLTQPRLKELLHYDAEAGVFTWRVACGRAGIGTMAGTISRGYRQIRADSRRYYAHRLAWLFVHGRFPKDEIDHINGVRDDNRIINLREATNTENHQNVAKNSNNSSGFPGVSWHSAAQKWQAGIRTGGKRNHIGYFDTPEAAHAAYLAAKTKFHTFNPTVRTAS